MGGFLLFLAGTMVGAFIGMALSALFAVSKYEDEHNVPPQKK